MGQKGPNGIANLELKNLLVVQRSTALTKDFDVASSSGLVRKLETNEILEQLSDLKEDEPRKITRVRVKAQSDGAEGWATIKGSQGSDFLSANSARTVVVPEVALQVSFSSSSRTVRMLKKGEVFEMTEGPKTETLKSTTRGRGRTLCAKGKKAQEGWFTIDDSTTQPWTPIYQVAATADLLDGPKASTAKVLRPLVVDEKLIVVEAPEASDDHLLRVRAEKDGLVGFAATQKSKDA